MGMKDIYGYKRNPTPEGVFSAEESILTFGGGSSVDLSQNIGYLVQNWNVSYQQQVQEIFEIGSSALYWMKGRPQGQGMLARVIGGKGADSPTSVKLFPQNAYDLCDGGALMVISAKSGACGANKSLGPTQHSFSPGGGDVAQVNIELHACVITNIGFSVDVRDALINESVTFRFGAMGLE